VAISVPINIVVDPSNEAGHGRLDYELPEIQQVVEKCGI
jgi:hypothetical protein